MLLLHCMFHGMLPGWSRQEILQDYLLVEKQEDGSILPAKTAIKLALEGKITSNIPSCLSSSAKEKTLLAEQAEEVAGRLINEWLEVMGIMGNRKQQCKESSLTIIYRYDGHTLKGQFSPKSNIHIYPLTCRAVYQSRLFKCELPGV